MSTVREKPKPTMKIELHAEEHMEMDQTIASAAGSADAHSRETKGETDRADKGASPRRRAPTISDRALRAVRCDVVPSPRRRRPAGRRDDLEASARRLEASGRYRVTRRLPSRTVERSPSRENARLVLVAHRRRTGSGKNGSRLAGVAFVLATFDQRGLRDVVAAFEEEGQPNLPFFAPVGRVSHAVPPTPEAMERYADRIDFCVSHDRGSLPDVLRTGLPVLRGIPWASARDAVDWRRLGVEGDGLSPILGRFGLFADVSEPRGGCDALVEALSADRWQTETDPPFMQLRRLLDARHVEVVATGPTYEIRDALKQRGYRWNHGVGGVGKHWSLVVSYRDALVEIAWLRHRLHGNGGSAEMRELN